MNELRNKTITTLEVAEMMEMVFSWICGGNGCAERK